MKLIAIFVSYGWSMGQVLGQGFEGSFEATGIKNFYTLFVTCRHEY